MIPLIGVQATAQSTLDTINQALATFVGTTAAMDDLTLVVISRDAIE